ncbi:MAG: hypothetical protein M3548_04535 [Actinomycetota bacterium]|nr:hypothetical protein [Actinomycetota bacterium]
MTTLEAVIPESLRQIPLPRNVQIKVLCQRYQHLKKLLEDTVPQLDRLLFTLPDADS